MLLRIGLISMAGSTRWRTFESRRVYRNQAVTAARLAALATHENQEGGVIASISGTKRLDIAPTHLIGRNQIPAPPGKTGLAALPQEGICHVTNAEAISVFCITKSIHLH
jgi:hypothetical protein